MNGRIAVAIPFGEQVHHIQLKKTNLMQVLSPHEKSAQADSRALVEQALSNPIGTKPLEELVKPGQRIVIVSEDNSRFARTDVLIEAIVSRLNRIGVGDGDIMIVMALGSHRKMTDSDIEKKVGSALFKRFACVNSEFRDPSLLVHLGTAPGGVEVHVDKRVAQADIRIGVGSIVPHPALGYSGGGKILYPGTVGEQTVAQLHLRSALIGQNIMGVAENQARLEMEQWVDTIGLDFIVNSVVTPDNKTYSIVAGHYVAAHRAGVACADEIYRLPAKGPVDLVVACSKSADLDLWQATKAVIGGERIVKDGGKLILYTPCPEGVGPHPDFPLYCKGEAVQEHLQAAKRGEFPIDRILPLSVGALLARVQKRIEVEIVSPGITVAAATSAGFVHRGSTIADLQHLLDEHYADASVSVLTHGGDSFAILEQ